MNTSNRNLVAVSGLGSIARQHIAAFRSIPGVEMIGFDPSEGQRTATLAHGGLTRAVAEFQELLAARPRALVIAAPDHMHMDQLKLAATAGIPTLVEKPLADSLTRAREAVPLVEESGTPVLVGYVLRHRQAVKAVRQLVTDGTIGTPTSFQVMLGAYETITVAANRFATPEPNRLYRDYSHEWDYIRWIFGPIHEVMAVARTTPKVPHVENPNLVDGLLVISEELVGSFHIDYVDPRGTRTLHIIGTEGSLQADFGLGTITVRRHGDDYDRVVQDVEPNAGPLVRQAQHLLDIASTGARPLVSMADGVAALEVTEALITSAAARSWVEV